MASQALGRILQRFFIWAMPYGPGLSGSNICATRILAYYPYRGCAWFTNFLASLGLEVPEVLTVTQRKSLRSILSGKSPYRLDAAIAAFPACLSVPFATAHGVRL